MPNELRNIKQWIKMPQLGFGVWQVEDNQATDAVAKALEVGYTSIDTAMIYKMKRRRKSATTILCSS